MRDRFLKTSLLAAAFYLSVVTQGFAADPLTRGLRYPSLTPDGKQVVFCYRGDLWISSVDGKAIRRLTIHEAQDTLPRVSPDGKSIAFSSLRHGRYDLYVIPLSGGVPKQLTFHSGSEALCDWSPDSKKLMFTSERGGGMGRMDLYEVDLAGGTPRRLTFDGARDGSYSPDGKQIIYARGFNSIYWDNYAGSANYDLYLTDTRGGVPKRLTKTGGNERYPFFSKDAKTIYFVAEQKGVANFYKMSIRGGLRSQVTAYTGADIHRPDLNWDNKTVVFERSGLLYTTNLEKPAKAPTQIPLRVKSDVRNSGLETRTITGGGEQVCVSRDGRQLAFTLRGDIWIMPAVGGRGRRVTSGPANDQWPRFSPDGSKIAYFSNAKGNNDIFLLDLKTGKTTELVADKANDHFHNWSPDGTRLVFCSERSGNRDIWVMDIKSGETKQLTKHRAGDDDPSFSPDGKSIAFDSSRAGTQAIYVMNADGSGMRRVTPGSSFFQVPSFSPDGKLLVYEQYNPVNGQSGGIFVISVGGGPSMQISRDGQTAHWSALDDYIYFTAKRGAAGDGVFRVKAPKSVVLGEHVPFIGEVTVDLRKELAQLFDEAWNALKSGFYDPKMHAVDWPAMRTKYRGMAIDSENKDEFKNIVRQMLAELGASHLGIWGGHKAGNSVVPRLNETGYLGLEFAAAGKDGSRRIASILGGGPADRAGLRAGDVITHIGRARLKATTNLDKALSGTVGKELRLSFRPHTAEGLGDLRGATVVPVGFGAIRGLEYRLWLAKCQKTVRAKSSPREQIAYIHLNAMNPSNLQRFQQAVARWNRNPRIKGMVLDVRNNGGGNIHNQLMSILIAKPLARTRNRNGRDVIQPSLYWNRPVVVLTNERSFSDAEVFPHMFKAAKVGKVIGVPTAGGVIGTVNVTLSDGSSFRIPRVGFWALDGTNLEGLGVKPDILVEESPEDRRLGRDPQLLTAIKTLKEDVMKAAKAAKKAAKPKVEKAPKKAAKPEATKALYTGKKAPANPLVNARVGDWLRVRAVRDSGSNCEMVISVISQTKESTLLKSVEIIEGRESLVDVTSHTRDKNLTPPTGVKLTGYGRSSVKVAGKSFDCAVMEGIDDKGQRVRWFICTDLPASGLVRLERNDKVVMELLTWGRASKAKK